MSLIKRLSILFISSKDQVLILLTFILFILFISAQFIIFIYLFFGLIALGFVCSFFGSFKCKIRLFIWDFILQFLMFLR